MFGKMQSWGYSKQGCGAVHLDMNMEGCSWKSQTIWKGVICCFWFKYDLGQKYQAPQVWPDQDSNSWPPDYDSTFHVTETPVLTTRSSVTSALHIKWDLTNLWILANKLWLPNKSTKPENIHCATVCEHSVKRIAKLLWFFISCEGC